jgi:glycosyltransferase involved in cell wall biosynthesis
MLHENYKRLPQVEVIYNGVPRYSEQEIAALRAEGLSRLQETGENVVIGFVGRLDENKNLSLLLRALGKLYPRFSDFRLIVVGEGPLRGRLVEEAAELGLQSRVHFLGSHSGVEPLIAAFDLLCLPSKSEGMPNVLMEAGALGVAVVATNVGGVPEIVSDEATGLLALPDDEAGFAHRLLRCLTSLELRTRLGRAGREHMQRAFSIPQMVNAYARLYERLL